MTNIKYQVSTNEAIGLIPCGAIVLNARIVQHGIDGTSLIFFPKNTKYEFEGKICTDKSSCSCISFAFLNGQQIWIRSGYDYINLPTRHKFESSRRWLLY